ncbi:uncharacterized protein YecT (DUF1311 family) [Novosphingobium capsulatum]|uniref:Uncharacterized protein YecT (DUF1311 family) n=1 Tax=Novosphingobium capsulatum TaxID=13688 RepID=A0ABU1MQK6_9SPHN|nr:lysozyme inhibitor LprI family protein [Novosphingobium capsulatum]MDR6512619.1 uncharacterized protein YecT (DUF1311 family) [Novosphingobium capsulatum]
MEIRQIAHLAVFVATPCAASAHAVERADKTDTELRRCLDGASNGSTAGQVGCEVAARDAYDKRMGAAYRALLRALPNDAAGKLREAQRAWLRFRDAHIQASNALFATRQGTMYVPMQAADHTAIVRQRAIELEAQLRIFRIDE